MTAKSINKFSNSEGREKVCVGKSVWNYVAVDERDKMFSKQNYDHRQNAHPQQGAQQQIGHGFYIKRVI